MTGTVRVSQFLSMHHDPVHVLRLSSIRGEPSVHIPQLQLMHHEPYLTGDSADNGRVHVRNRMDVEIVR